MWIHLHARKTIAPERRPAGSDPGSEGQMGASISPIPAFQQVHYADGNRIASPDNFVDRRRSLVAQVVRVEPSIRQVLYKSQQYLWSQRGLCKADEHVSNVLMMVASSRNKHRQQVDELARRLHFRQLAHRTGLLALPPLRPTGKSKRLLPSWEASRSTRFITSSFDAFASSSGVTRGPTNDIGSIGSRSQWSVLGNCVFSRAFRILASSLKSLSGMPLSKCMRDCRVHFLASNRSAACISAYCSDVYRSNLLIAASRRRRCALSR